MIEKYALSLGQLSMLYHHLTYPKSYGNYELQHFVLTGDIRENILCKAWNQVFKHYPILRTHIGWDNQKIPIQIIDNDIPNITVKSIGKVSCLYKNLQLEILERHRVDMSKQIFTVTIWLNDDSADMFIHTHHIIYDGWSTSILIRDFMEAYQSIQFNVDINKNNKSEVIYLHFTIACEKQEGDRKTLMFFQKYLDGYRHPFPRRMDYPLRFNSKEYRNWNISISYADLQKAACRFQVTGAALMVAAIGVSLCRMYRVENMVIGVVFSGRVPSFLCAESIVGPLINVMPLRLPSISSWEKAPQYYIQTVGVDLIHLGEYQNFPLQKILKNIEENSFIPYHTVIAFQNYPLDPRIISMNTDNFYIRYIQSRYYPLNDLSIEIKLFQNTSILEFCYTKNLISFKAVHLLAQDIISRLKTLLL